MKLFDSRVETLQTQYMTHCTVLAQQGVQQQTSVRRKRVCYSEPTKTANILWKTQEMVFSLLESLLDFRKNTKLQCQTLHQIFSLSLLHCSSSVPFHVLTTHAFSSVFVFPSFTANFIWIDMLFASFYNDLPVFYFCIAHFLYHLVCQEKLVSSFICLRWFFFVSCTPSILLLV